MVPAIRNEYNQRFTQDAYQRFLNELQSVYPGQLDFRVAETPIFIPKIFLNKVLTACENIVDAVMQPDYHRQSERALPPHIKVPNEDAHPHFIAFDFGICQNEQGEIEPQLIEMQGFPTIFAYQIMMHGIFKKHFWLPENYDPYLNGFNSDTYAALLRKILTGDGDPKETVLLEVHPQKQKTRVDFHSTETYTGVQTVDLMDVLQDGKNLFYLRDGKKTPIKRIYNRLIFDDLFQQPAGVREKGKLFQQDLNVTWVPHPNWFYRISKFSLPFIQHPYVPETHFLSDVKSLPADLENYVVKPLFSFAGQGVIIDVTKADIEKIKEPENWILQRKVNYAAVIETPGEPAKAEIRIFYFWEEGKARPVATNNLARLSKGKMVGVRYNKDKEWVGGSYCLFER